MGKNQTWSSQARIAKFYQEFSEIGNINEQSYYALKKDRLLSFVYAEHTQKTRRTMLQ